jgi:hypothetical protein
LVLEIIVDLAGVQETTCATDKAPLQAIVHRCPPKAKVQPSRFIVRSRRRAGVKSDASALRRYTAKLDINLGCNGATEGYC